MDREPRVVVVGGGAAGLMAACAAAEHCRTRLLTDRALGACNSAMAQGGLQVSLADQESKQRFVDDIVRSARVPLDEDLVRQFVDGALGCVEQLQTWGLELDHDDGGLVRRFAGGLSEPRIVSSADSIGTSLMRVLVERIDTLDVEVEARTRVTRVDPVDGHLELHLRDPDNAEDVLRCDHVVVATGGRTYRVARERGEGSTNPPNSNHVLYDALCELGLETLHDEYFQYQPFGIVSFATGSVGRCVPESIVNLPVRLLDRRGDVVCDLTLDRLAVRDAMQDALDRGDGESTARGPGLRLTLSAVSDDELRERFPRLASLLARNGALGDDVLVRPLLHYQLGGFRTPLHGRTSVDGLFLAGEMTGGLHGRNRLMGNGITESLVRGWMTGRAAAASALGHSPTANG